MNKKNSRYLFGLIVGISMPMCTFTSGTYIDKTKKGFHSIVQCVRGDDGCERKNIIVARIGCGLCGIGMLIALRYGIKSFNEYRVVKRYDEATQDAWIAYGKGLRFERSINDLVPYLQNKQITPENCKKVAELIEVMKAQQKELGDDRHAENKFTRTMCDAYTIPSSTEKFINELSTLYTITP